MSSSVSEGQGYSPEAVGIWEQMWQWVTGHILLVVIILIVIAIIAGYYYYVNYYYSKKTKKIKRFQDARRQRPANVQRQQRSTGPGLEQRQPDYTNCFYETADIFREGMDGLRKAAEKISNRDNSAMRLSHQVHELDTKYKGMSDGIQKINEENIKLLNVVNQMKDSSERVDSRVVDIDKKIEDLHQQMVQLEKAKESQMEVQYPWISELGKQYPGNMETENIGKLIFVMDGLDKNRENYHLLVKLLSVELGAMLFSILNSNKRIRSKMSEMAVEGANEWLNRRKYGFRHFIPKLGGGFNPEREVLVNSIQDGSNQLNITKVISWGLEDSLEKDNIIEKARVEATPV